MTNNESMGGASPHNELIARVIVRSSGDSATIEAMNSKTHSPYKATEKHYHWEGCGEGWGGNVKR